MIVPPPEHNAKLIEEDKQILAALSQVPAQCDGWPLCVHGERLVDCVPCNTMLQREMAPLRREMREVEAKLHAITNVVQNKYEGESRFETALRYVRERVDRQNFPCGSTREANA